ncbi:13233_t:CDS:2, partial [Acaulospora morrowiae]
SDMLSEDERRAVHFLNLSAQNQDLPYRPFLRKLNDDEEFDSLSSAKILAILICSTNKPLSFDVTEYFRWITSKLKSSNASIYDLAVQILESVLRVPSCRLQFWNSVQGVDALVNILKTKNPSPQMQYQIIFCFWLLTFEKDIAAQFN